MTDKRTALNEVVETAEAEGWIVQVHPVTRFTTHSATTRRSTDHDDIVVTIQPSPEMRAALGQWSGDPSVIALFRPSGAFHVAFRTGATFDDIQRRAEAEAARRVQYMVNANEAFARGDDARAKKWRTGPDGKRLPPHTEHEIESAKERVRGDARYKSISYNQRRLTKADLLHELVDHPIRRAERRAANKAEAEVQRREKEAERLRTQVIPAAEQRRDIALRDATASLEEVNQVVAAAHPMLASAPGLVYSIVFGLLGDDNDPERPLIRFIHARGALAQAEKELAKAAEVLGASTKA